MNQRTRDEKLGTPNETHVVLLRPLWARIAMYMAITLLILMVVAIAVLWIERRPVATYFLKGEFERRGVQAQYHLDRVGFRTQQVSNLVIGDPNHPDLLAKEAIIQMRLKLDGSFNVYRVVARGVRLKGRLVHGRVSWGQIDKLLPPPTNKPFQLPDIVLDVADSSVSLATPFGPVGLAVEGNGRLSGGFKGRLAIASPRLVPGRCAAVNLRTNAAVSVVGRRPQIEGPVTLDSFVCPASRFFVVAPTFEAKASFNESLTSVDGSGQMAISTLTAGANGLAAFVGDITYKGSLVNVNGRVNLSAQKSRMATATAERTRLNGAYRLGMRAGSFVLVGDFVADNSTLDPKQLDSITVPLASAAGTPIGPVTTSIGNAIGRTASRFNAAGQIRVVTFPHGGAARITSADIKAGNGARARIGGGSGVTYYWPKALLRVDGVIDLGGGGLPSGRVVLRQPHPGGPLSGIADLAPYSANGERLALAPIKFGPGPAGSTAVTTIALLDGPFPSGRVTALRLPIQGRLGPGGAFAVGTACAVVSFDHLKMSTLQLGPTRLPVCPLGPAIVYKHEGGPVIASARLNGPVLDGHLGSSPLHLAAANGQITSKQFFFNNISMRLGKPTAPISFDAVRLNGRFAGSNLSGDFTNAKAAVGTVPLLLSDASGGWRYRSSKLTVDGALTLSDADPNPRFYPLKSSDVHLAIGGDYVRATGSLHRPETGMLVTNVSIEHRLSTNSGHAILDVPGLTFGPNFQPEQLTRLTEGVVALVSGTLTGQGRINWGPGVAVTSTGEFSTANMDLAAPFGPVTGLRTTMHFTNLLGLETAPHQVATAQSINPGITVENGVITYQLLPHNLVRIERGEWPFMGGRLILRETVLNFGTPSAKRLTFELQGFDAKQFVDSLGFSGIQITGTFDGVLPMIFDESGGRIVGGRLDSRSPGGEIKYTGTKPGGMTAGIAFDLFSDIRFKSMIVRLNGDLAGEFASTMTIDGVSLGESHGFVAGLVHKVFSQLPIRLNVNINGPFRALIQMAKAFKDPTQVIAPVMPFPIDSPALKVDVLSTTKNEEQQPTPPAAPAQPANKSSPPGGKK
ncbi:MAG TPA: YdbH domain-containing protein [Sphingomicrobium sp.]|nr:YdbH domain-containing protein [Sphingomicrobium sp.]